MTGDDRVRAAANAVLTLSAEVARLRAECERHRRANLVRAVKGGYEEWITEAINAEDWDAIPWRVCDRVRADLDRALDAVERALNELGVPDEHYPAPVANAVEILRAVLNAHDREAK